MVKLALIVSGLMKASYDKYTNILLPSIQIWIFYLLSIFVLTWILMYNFMGKFEWVIINFFELFKINSNYQL